MTFDAILAQVLDVLRRQGRVSYRALKRRFDLDDEYIEDLKAVLDAPLVDLLAEHGLGAALVPARIEVEFAAVDVVRHAELPLQTVHPVVFRAFDRRRRRTPIAAGVGDGPAGKAFRDLDDVGLGVAVIDAERVQLH